MPRIPQTPEQLEGQLAEQVAFLQADAESFDRGSAAHAKRLALAVRLLVYDQKQSRSLLGQLGQKDIPFFDSALPHDPAYPRDQWGLVVMTGGGNEPTFVAPLDVLPPGAGRWTDYDSWWSQVVFQDNQRRTIKRGELVLTVANQDGGAHVDPSLNEVYAALSRENSLGWMKGQTPADPPHLHAVRQVAHELLKTLIPGYTKGAARPPSMMLAGIRVEQVSTPVPRLGRNDPCYCGSKKKFKKCHGM